jgi:ABC-type transport system involved in cytochrome c biogenesis permease subunit
MRPGSRVCCRRAALVGALALHAAFLVWRSVQVRALPVESRFDSASLFLWVSGVVFLAAQRPYSLSGVGTVFWPVHALAAAAVWLLVGTGTTPQDSIGPFLLILHLIPVYIGYAGFAVAAMAGATYLLQERLLRRKSAAALWRRFPSLETLDRVDRTALALGFPMLTLGLAFGVLWATMESSPLGPGWHTDPKVLGGFVVWLFYAAVLHVRLFVRMRGRHGALLTLLGFVLTLVSFATVHAYRDTVPESQGARETERP